MSRRQSKSANGIPQGIRPNRFPRSRVSRPIKNLRKQPTKHTTNGDTIETTNEDNELSEAEKSQKYYENRFR